MKQQQINKPRCKITYKVRAVSHNTAYFKYHLLYGKTLNINFYMMQQKKTQTNKVETKTTQNWKKNLKDWCMILIFHL